MIQVKKLVSYVKIYIYFLALQAQPPPPPLGHGTTSWAPLVDSLDYCL